MAMVQQDYDNFCNDLLSKTMQYIDTSKIKCYNIDKKTIQSDDPIYRSAAASKAPISLVYTPPGSGKSALIKERALTLKNAGTPAHKICILNMNVSKVKEMQRSLPDMTVMTFNDFTFGLFHENFPAIKMSNMDTINNILRLGNVKNKAELDKVPEEIKEKFMTYLSMHDQQGKNVLLFLFINQHLNDVLSLINATERTDYALASMITYNLLYTFKKNPYNFDSIIINGIHNMPLQVFCSILEYVNRYGVNLFLTGSTGETIYEFNMAYSDIMNDLSSYPDKIDVIRMTRSIISNDVANVLNMNPYARNMDHIFSRNAIVPNDDMLYDTIKTCIDPDNTSYITDIFNTHQKLLVVARSKMDIACIKTAMEHLYFDKFPNLKTVDLTSIQSPKYVGGRMLSIYHEGLENRYPRGITVKQLGYELYEAMTNVIYDLESDYVKLQYQTNRDMLPSFLKNPIFGDIDKMWNVSDLIETFILAEEQLQNDYAKDIKQTVINFTNVDLIYSTIHSAIDIRCDNALILFKNATENVDQNMYRSALSRANKSEFIIFCNKRKFEIELQKYLNVINPKNSKNI